MDELRGKVAVITGAGSGIGRATALALAEAGVHVVVADIDEASASRVAGEVERSGVRARAVRTDVADASSVQQLADAAYAEFGAVHVLHNNAGVAVTMPIDVTSAADWEWTLSVNLQGVVNGLQAFLPRLKAQDGQKHIVNTASLAGMISLPGFGAYSASKFAVVTISETLREELIDEGFGVSVLCPGFVTSNLPETSQRLRPPGGPEAVPIDFSKLDPRMLNFVEPEAVGRLVLDAIRRNELYIFPHPEWDFLVRERFDRILGAMDRAKQRQGR